MAIPLHILELRRIASEIKRLVYSNRQAADLSVEEAERITDTLHKRLLEWRRTTPFPLPNVHVPVPHLNSTWYDFNYYSHLAMIYRPSPLFPTLTMSRVKTLAEAASMSIRQVFSMHQQHCLAYNWLNLLSIFTVTLSLVYATVVQPEKLSTTLKETKAVDDLKLATELFEKLSLKFTAADKIRRMVEEILRKYEQFLSTED